MSDRTIPANPQAWWLRLVPAAPHGASGQAAWQPMQLLAASALLTLAVAVRLVWLESDPLWFDEAATIGIARMDWSIILGPMAAVESSPPGFYMLAKLWIMLFGEGIFAVRLLPVLAGVLGLLPVWLLARAAQDSVAAPGPRDGAGHRAAWLAALLLALAASHVRMSQDARCYTVLFLVVAWAALLGTLLATAVRDAKPALARAVGFGALLGAMLWLHATAAIIGITLNVLVLASLASSWRLMWRGLRWLLLANVLAAVLAAAPLFAMLALVFKEATFADRWIEAPSLFDTIVLYVRTLVAPFLGPLSPLALLAQIAALLVACLRWWRIRAPGLIGLAAMLASGALLLPVLSQFWPVLLDRTALFLLVPLVVLLAVGTAALPRRAFWPAAAFLVALQALGVLGWHQWEVRKERWDSAAVLLHERLRPGEPVVISEGAFIEISLTAHLRRIKAPVPRIIMVPPTAALERLAADQLARERVIDASELHGALLGSAGGVWLVMRELADAIVDDAGFTSRDAVRAALRRAGGMLVDEISVPGLKMEHWSVPRS